MRLSTRTVTSQSDAPWNAFSPFETVEIGYDMNDRPVTQAFKGGGTTHALIQTSHDALGRVECVAQRMNPAAFASSPASACALGAEGSYGPDRIVKTHYDAAGQAVKLTEALGTSAEADVVTRTYTPNGLVATLKDAENNLTSYEYDGHDRLARMLYPVPTKGAGVSSASDYESYTHDPAGNVTSFRNRAGQVISYSHDDLGRLVAKDLPAGEADVSYGHDLLGRMTSAAKAGHALAFAFDALGRMTSAAGPLGTVSYQYDLAGRRTRMTWPDGFFVDYDHLVTGEMTRIRENGATAGAGVLATFSYDDRGRRTSLTRGNGTTATYAYDPVSRLSQFTENLAGASHDLTLDFSYNPASQITSNTRSNDAYAFDPANMSVNYTANGLNQLIQAGSTNLSWDAKGNLTSDGTRTFAYSSENLLTSSGSVSLDYDPLMRLFEVAAGAGSDRFLYDGLDLIAEYDGQSALQRRYVHGPGMDEPLAWYEGSGTSDRRFLHADERGSIIAISGANGSTLAINAYGPYGTPASSNLGRFQYTGQAWMEELGLYYYKARFYAPALGRFMQTDPIGYWGGMNLYTYVGGDPVNFIDPLGLQQGEPEPPDDAKEMPPIIVEACHWGMVRTEDGQCVPTNLWLIRFLDRWGLNELPFGLNSLEVGFGNASPQNEEEDLLQCVANNTDAGGLTGAVVGGAAAIGAGAPILPKSLLTGRSGTLGGGGPSGARTSVLSAAARGFIGPEPKLKPGSFLAKATNTGKVATAVGRIASRASIIGGAALELYALGEVAVEAYKCSTD